MLNVSLPISKLIQSMYQSIVDRGLGNDDHSALYQRNLSNRIKNSFGAHNQNRTDDPVLTMDVLYLLSYVGLFVTF